VMSETRERTVGYVRGATNRFLSLYDQVKRVSPLLQYGLEKVEQMPWNKAEPVIDGLDSRIDSVKESVTTRVCAIQKRYEAGKQTVVAGIATSKQTVAAGIEQGKQTVATGYETSKRSVVAGASKTTEKWKDLRGDLSKKAAARMEQGLTRLNEFSATRGKEIIHVDLIQYSKEVIDGASEAVSRKMDAIKPMYEPVLHNLAASVLKANQAANNLRRSVLEATQRANLRERVKSARRAARELSSTSIAYVQAKFGDLASHVPSPTESFHKALQFIMSSPELFVKIKNKADLDASKHTLDNLNNLMAAVRDVLFHDEEPSAAIVPTEEMEEVSESDQPLD